MKSKAVVREFQRLLEPGTIAGLTENQVLERFAECGDPIAFEAIVTRHGPMVYTLCRQILRDPNDVNDAFQGTFLILIKKAGTLRRPERLAPWLFGVAYRVAHRARTRRKTKELPGDLAGPRLACPVEDNEQVEAIHDEIERLPENYRVPIVLCCIEGLSHDQAATRLGWPVGTVHGRLARARELLRRRLTRRGVTLSAGIPDALALLRPVQTSLPEATRHAAVALIGGTVTASLEILTRGVLSAMITEKLKQTGMIVVMSLIGLGTVTTALLAYQGPERRREAPNGRLIVREDDQAVTSTSTQTSEAPSGPGGNNKTDEAAVSELERRRVQAELLEIEIAYQKQVIKMLVQSSAESREYVHNPQVNEAISREERDKLQDERLKAIHLREERLAQYKETYVENRAKLSLLQRRIARESKALEEPINQGQSVTDVVRRLDRLEEKVDQLIKALPAKTGR